MTPHPVQPLPADYVPPVAIDGVLRGDMVTIDGQTLVAWECRDGLRLTDKQTGAVEAFVAWAEIDR